MICLLSQPYLITLSAKGGPMIYNLDASPAALVRHEASLVLMTATQFLSTRRRRSMPGKLRLCYHFVVERGMTSGDASHWMDSDPTTVLYHVRRYEQLDAPCAYEKGLIGSDCESNFASP